MAQRSFVWLGTTLGDATDAPYSDSDWWDIEKYINGYGASRSNYGPIKGNGNGVIESLQVTETSPASAAVSVNPGSALVTGSSYINDAAVTLSISANASGNPRIDTVVLRKDYAAQTVRLAVLTGTPAATPAAPTLTQTDGVLWEIPLADVAVAAGFVTITNSNITPNAHYANLSDGVYVDNVLNNSGVTLETGDVVVWDSTSDRAVTTTTTADNRNTAGVWVGRTNAGAYGRVLVRGIGYVKTNGAVAARLDGLTSSTTAKQAQAAQGYIPRIGFALQTTSGAGLCIAMVNALGARRGVDYLKYTDTKSSGTNGGTSSAAAYQTRTLNTEDFDTGGFGAVAANQITLQPGTYIFSARAPATAVASVMAHRLRLQNVTDATTVATGENAYISITAGSVMTHAFVTGVFTITSAKAFELQHYTSASFANTGLGVAVSGGGNEMYAEIEFWRLG